MRGKKTRIIKQRLSGRKIMIRKLLILFACLVGVIQCQSSSLTCYPGNTVVAGTQVTCIARYYYAGILNGTSACEARLYLCKNGTTFVAGSNTTSYFMTLNNATLTSTGVFRFELYPTIAGNFFVRATVQKAITVGSAFSLKVTPAAIVVSPTAATCSVTNQTTGVTACVAIGKDRFSNTVRTCTTTYVLGNASSTTEVCVYS